MKSLSQRLKKAAARDEAAVLLVKAWYVDHMIFAQASMQNFYAEHNMYTAGQTGQKRNASSASHNPIDESRPSLEVVREAKRRLTEGRQKLDDDINQVVVTAPDGGSSRIPKNVAKFLKNGVSATQADNMC